VLDAQTATALTAGTGFADLSFWRKVALSGAEARTWLNDLVSADIADLAPGRARRALLLSPTGRVRAEFTVAMPGETLVLLQDPAQPRSIVDLLSLYVLSSDVRLGDRTDDLTVFAFPGRTTSADIAGATHSAPSCLGSGVDLIGRGHDHDRLLTSLAGSFTRIGNEEVEAWRISSGIPKFGVDALEDDLPQECGLASAVSFEKGCFLGQEAVARVRNLGHPRRQLLKLESEDAVAAGEPILEGEREVGEVTSAARVDGRTVMLARVRWGSGQGALRTALGAELTPRGVDPLS
jgi:tRNA-modifying protein YgfZ